MAFLQCFIIYKTLSHLLSKWILPWNSGRWQGEYYYYPHFTNDGFESWTWDFCHKSFPRHLDCSLITIIPNTLRAIEIKTNKFTLQVEKAKCVCWEKWEQKLKEQPSSAGFPPPPPDHQKGKAIKKDGIRLAGQSQNEEWSQSGITCSLLT